MRILLTSCLALLLAACAAPVVEGPSDTVVITVVGTNDVHGELVPQEDRGGIVTFSGYVAALRQARENDGALLLVDAGDMWQGTLESNLTEGAPVVQAYNALGYDAAAVGNHEFDFGPAGPKAIPHNGEDDPRGALLQRAAEMEFALLSANIVVASTGKRVEWGNVQASVMIDKAGVDIGVIGVITTLTPATTLPANISDLRIAPLADAIAVEARSLRNAGADLIIVLAHAGGRCTEFDDPEDLSSCSPDMEIMRVARAIPEGLVDHIVAGHHHNGIAHVVNGIAVTSAYSNARAFSRVDFTVARDSGEVLARKIFPPQHSVQQETYEGLPLRPMVTVASIADSAHENVEELMTQPVGAYLETPFTARRGPEFELGNLFVDAVREFSGADIAIHNVRGGIRAELPAGELTYGSVFRMFPFDNRIAIIELSGAELRALVAAQAQNTGRWAGFSGVRMRVSCVDNRMSVRLLRPNGEEIADDDLLSVAVNDFLLLGGDDVLTPVTPDEGFTVPYDTVLVRDALLAWFQKRGSSLRAEEFLDPDNPRWSLPDPLPASCAYSR